MNLLQILKNSISTLYVRYIGNEEIENLPIYYIGGSQTLPPPLSSEEEAEVL
ncbi:MAG: RNA polymerase sporulation sigma factor SigE, partial [Clostridia bacterium]|nr:RNA polymerase sporulation sigma factor SigE [Clostridia bacterium]